MEYRPLEGFVYAISPFNFTALGGSLISGPALMGNVVLWKPSPSNIYASTLVYKILLEAGLPPDVVQFVPGDAEQITEVALCHRDFAGLNFIGSSDIFRSIHAKIGEGIGKKTYREFREWLARRVARISISFTTLPISQALSITPFAAPLSTRARSAPRPPVCISQSPVRKSS
jgi:hypothetical protein